jgi:hypothetical protein
VIPELPKRMRDAALHAANRELSAKHARGEFDEGDPNHPMHNDGINYTRPLFGHKTADFLAKQYRTTRTNQHSED